MTASAEDLSARGVELVNAGRYTAARAVLADAAAAAARDGDSDVQARVTGTTAYLLARLGDVDGGVALCRQAIARTDLGEDTRAILAGQMGALELERGALDSAVSWLTDAIDALDGDPVRSANMRMNRSVADMQRGRWEAAADDLHWAEAAYRAAGRALEAEQAVHNRGYVAMLSGDLVTALSLMQSVREPLDGESDFWAAVNELDHAEVLRDAGLQTEAEHALANVVHVLGRHRAPGERARAEYQLARSLLDHDPARAAAVAHASARRFRGQGSHAWAARADGIRLRARLSHGRLDRAGTPLTPGRPPSPVAVAAVVEALETHGFPHDAAALRLTAALDALRRGGDPGIRGPRLRAGTPLDIAMLSHEVAAERARRAGRESDARRRAAQGIDLLEQSQRLGASLEQSGSIARQGLGLMMTGLASALRSGRPDIVFEWSERSRHLHTQVVPLRPPPDPVLASELEELRRIRLADPDGDWLTDARVDVLRARARERQWARTRTAAVHDRVTLGRAQAALDEDTVLISFVFDGRAFVALVVDRDSARLVDIDASRVRTAIEGLRADLDVSAAVRSGPMAAVVQQALAGRLEQLSHETVGRALAGARDPARVVLTAPGLLAGIPWTMLPAMRGRALTIAPSASRWVAESAARPRRAARAVFAAGPRVARGDEEVLTAAGTWGEHVVLHGAEATVAAVTASATTADVLHIAAHGRHAADHPLFSGLELADGTLFGYDVDLIPDVPQTVVLSACEVGRSTVRWGEEAVGMTRVWLHAGARAVVAAPVAVADDVACEVLGAMHAGLAAGETPSAALASATSRTGILAPFQVHGTGF
ncbi:CHAT domain-containing protein [Microbacterium sp. NPDC055910]|uniref:CHAT domain-containing protein n=1 Tax=Microbacterium sp. NPDC055910 TaxID=3345659 RepID=UPI0035D96F16